MTTARNGVATVEHEIGPSGELTLRVHTGDVAIHGTDEAFVRVRSLDGRDLEDGFAIERAEGRLSMRPRDRAVFDLGRRGRSATRLVVEVPRGASVSLDTASADLRVDGLAGDQRYRTASGSLELTRASGAIGIDAVSGDLAIDAAGEIELSGRLVSGDLRVRGGIIRTAALGTTSGDVDLASPLAGPGPYSIQTVSGDARVVAGSEGLRVEAKTVTGEIVADPVHGAESGPGQRLIVVGRGGATLSFRSISGDLRVTAAGGVDHEMPSAKQVATTFAPAPPQPPEPPAPPAPVGSAPSLGARPGSDADPDEDRLAVLRELEAGAIDVATATQRLAELEASADD